MEREDWAWVAVWLTGRFETDIAEKWVSRNAPKDFIWGWSDGSWHMWWKRQLDRCRLLRVSDYVFDDPKFSTRLHVFFLSIEETPEMLARLPEEDGKERKGPTTPGISRTNRKPKPIDRTAQRVTGFKD